jgi:hypothetical protein
MNNACREPQAERQVDKEQGNFCDWFSLGGRGGAKDDKAAAARARLDAMFGKKGTELGVLCVLCGPMF